MRRLLPYPLECLRLGLGRIIWGGAAALEWVWRRRCSALMAGGALIVWSAVPGGGASVRADAPHVHDIPTISRYISWMTGDLETDVSTADLLGCEAAQVSDGGTVVLAFGRQVDGGTRSFDGPTALYSYDHIAGVVRGYAGGLGRCGSDAWTVAATTSNYRLYDAGVAAEYGAAWKQLVHEMRDSTEDVRITGGIDLEPGWGGAAAARAWIDAWRVAGGTSLVVNASADGCPLQGDRGACANGWDVDLLASLVWGTEKSIALPQIYRHDGAMARQWGVLARAWERVGGEPVFAGPMTQVRACQLVQSDNCRQLSLPAEEARMQLREATAGRYSIPAGTDVGWG